MFSNQRIGDIYRCLSVRRPSDSAPSIKEFHTGTSLNQYLCFYFIVFFIGIFISFFFFFLVTLLSCFVLRYTRPGYDGVFREQKKYTKYSRLVNRAQSDRPDSIPVWVEAKKSNALKSVFSISLRSRLDVFPISYGLILYLFPHCVPEYDVFA